LGSFKVQQLLDIEWETPSVTINLCWYDGWDMFSLDIKNFHFPFLNSHGSSFLIQVGHSLPSPGTPNYHFLFFIYLFPPYTSFSLPNPSISLSLS